MSVRWLVALFVVVSIGGAIVPTTIVTGDVDGITATAAVVPAEDGGVWVLERSLQGGGGTLFHYDDDWERTPRSQTIDRRVVESPTDIVRADDDGWWVLGTDARVYRYRANWTYTGEAHNLTLPYSEYPASRAFGLTRVSDGGWWVAADRDFLRYESNWTPTAGGVDTLWSESMDGIWTGRPGYPVAVGYDSPTQLWVLKGYTGQSVARYALTDDGRRIDPMTVRNASAYGTRLQHALPTDQYPIHRAVTSPVDAVRADDGWWILDADGAVHHVDEHWRYTGETHDVGSGDVEGAYPPDLIGLGVLLGPLVSWLGWITPGVLISLSFVLDDRFRSDLTLPLALCYSLATVYGVVLDPYTLRPFVFAHSLGPLAFVIFTLTVPAAHFRLLGIEHRVRYVLVGYAPSVLAGFGLFGLAVRPVLSI